MPTSFAQLKKASRVALIIQGILAIIFGILILAWPGVTLTVFIALFAAWAIVNGILEVVSYFSRDKEHRSGWLLASAALSIVAGIVAIFLPSATAIALLYVIAVWSIVVGVLHIVLSLRLKKTGLTGWWALLIAGILGIIAGIVLMMFPGTGILALLWVVAVFVIAEGISAIILGIKIGSKKNRDALLA